MFHELTIDSIAARTLLSPGGFLLVAVDGCPSVADLRAAGAQRI
jgi:hypothetical protein